jgi:aquaporin Z
VFWLAPLIGGAIAGLLYPLLFGRAEQTADHPSDPRDTAPASTG